ncbi:hypothetical protein D1013_11310 [Euzebyella marina]|uniref:Uncharacterized protein n=1 Tax=Euzebyella marina TaxID=1761453 RepID=A0A3G2L6L8_9FLAO|nr:hypothetical protein [Euzebyella marina]AYN67922.1 hypothetical protein D1013_11310 [Euzebyella marina]
MLKRTNVQEVLNKNRGKHISGDHLIAQVQRIFDETASQRSRISTTLSNGGSAARNSFQLDLLESNKIYHLDDIRLTCINYRLRFLDSKYFKGQIPEEAVSIIRQLEKDHETEISGLKILAPSKLFKLEDKDDPLLFAPIGNDYFYLIHKWGNDLHPLRRWLMWPFKSIVNLTLLVVMISYVLTLMVPEGLFSKKSTSAEFWIIFFFMFKCLASVVIFYGFALGKNFNPAIWNSKYYNA